MFLVRLRGERGSRFALSHAAMALPRSTYHSVRDGGLRRPALESEMQSRAVPDVSHGAPNNPPMRAARRRTMGSPDVLRMTPLPLQMSAIPRPADRLADATELGKRAALHSPAAAAKPLHSRAPRYES